MVGVTKDYQIDQIITQGSSVYRKAALIYNVLGGMGHYKLILTSAAFCIGHEPCSSAPPIFDSTRDYAAPPRLVTPVARSENRVYEKYLSIVIVSLSSSYQALYHHPLSYANCLLNTQFASFHLPINHHDYSDHSFKDRTSLLPLDSPRHRVKITNLEIF